METKDPRLLATCGRTSRTHSYNRSLGSLGKVNNQRMQCPIPEHLQPGATRTASIHRRATGKLTKAYAFLKTAQGQDEECPQAQNESDSWFCVLPDEETPPAKTDSQISQLIT